MSVKRYSPSQIVVNVMGQDLSGFGESSVVKVSFVSDQITDQVGTDGEVGIVESADGRGEIEVTLMQTSASNDVLSASSIAKQVSSMIIKDLYGRTLYSAPNCWITKPADGEMAKELKDRTWKLRCDKLKAFLGGN